MTSSPPIVLAQGLQFQRLEGGFSLDVEQLQIEKGESVALVGPSGCGKTTLISLIAGILKPNAGSLVVLGQEQHSAPEVQRRALRLGQIGMVFQEFSLLDYLNARDNVLLPLLLQGRSIEHKDREEALALLDSLGLASAALRHPPALSTGERQRVAICRALLLNPSLVLADEPTGSLDAARGEEVFELLISACQARGTSLLLVTHDANLARRCDRTIDCLTYSGEALP